MRAGRVHGPRPLRNSISARRPERWSRALPALLFLVGMAASLLVGLEYRGRLQGDQRLGLTEDAAEITRLLELYASNLESSMSSTAAVAEMANGDLALLDEFVAIDGEAAGQAVIDLSRTPPTVVKVLEHDGEAGGDWGGTVEHITSRANELFATPTFADEAMTAAAEGGLHVIPVVDVDRPALVLLAAADGTPSYASVRIVELGPIAPYAATQLSEASHLALIHGDDAATGTVVLASTNRLPLPGTTVTRTTEIASARFLVVVSAPSTPLTPFFLAAGLGLAGTTIVVLLMLSLQRRGMAAERARRDAARARAHLSSVLEASPDTAIVLRPGVEQIEVLNRDDVFGWPVGSITDKDAFLSHFDEESRTQLAGFCTPGEVPPIDTDGIVVRLLRPNQTEVWARVRTTQLGEPEDDDWGSGTLVLLTDITDARRSHLERDQLEQELHQAQRMETIGKLAGGIAHDFNNLLAAISSTAELIAEDAGSDETRADAGEIIAATRRGAGLTRRLLTFSRRGMRVEETLDLGVTAEASIALLRRTLDERIRLSVDIGDEPLPVFADPAEIEQVVLNLVVNARDALPTNGDLSRHRIDVRCCRNGANAVIEVSDNGRGMPKEVQRRACEPFFSTKPSDKGTGLGLSIVYGIVSRADGALTIESTPGEGTTVRVEIPLTAEAAERGEEPRKTNAQEERTMETVLLVEDEPAVRRAAQRLIERGGHTVVVAADGAEAVHHLESGLRPTVLLTDVVLPGSLTGRDVADRTRAWVPGVRVVYASGYPQDVVTGGDLVEADVSFVGKPFTSATLLAAIDGSGAVPESELV